MIGKRRRQQQSVTRLARGEPCLIRIPTVCCFDVDTTVPCHLRLPGLSGAGFIADIPFFAFGCYTCHLWVDSHHDLETRCAFYEGVFRTQALLKERGVIVVAA